MENWSVGKYYSDAIVIYRPAWGIGVSENTTGRHSHIQASMGKGGVRKYYHDAVDVHRPAWRIGVSEDTTVTQLSYTGQRWEWECLKILP